MELLPGFRTIGCALLFRKTLVLSDLHLGYEKALGAGTGFISRFQFDELIRELDWVFRVAGKLDAIVLNGDIKHEFGTIEEREWRYVLRFLDYLQKHAKRIILIKGNHDTLLKPIAEKRSYPLEPFVLLHDVLITHGDEITNEFKKAAKKAKTIVIGHEHPAVTLRKGSRSETFKCFLPGKWKSKGGGAGAPCRDAEEGLTFGDLQVLPRRKMEKEQDDRPAICQSADAGHRYPEQRPPQPLPRLPFILPGVSRRGRRSL